MPVYEYLCRTCDTRFEARRPVSESGSPIDCPDGHGDTTRLLSVFASVGRSQAYPTRDARGGGPGSCGAGCACAS
jgi:putative FmdB family regulatory protein